MATKTYRLRVLNKDEDKTEKILTGMESSQFAIINSERFSVGSLYEIGSSKSKIIQLKSKLKIKNIKYTIK